MKYFTPDLIARGQSADPQITDEVEQQWDAAITNYQAELEATRPSMPPGLRRFDEEWSLHDAAIRAISIRDDRLTIVLQSDAPARSMLTVTFDLLDTPQVDRDALPEFVRSGDGTALWMYEEVEQTKGGWRMRILLSNGWELAISFRDLKVETSQPLWPASAMTPILH